MAGDREWVTRPVSGSRPNQVIHALVAEGYLEGDPRMRARPKVQPMGDPASDLAEGEG